MIDDDTDRAIAARMILEHELYAEAWRTAEEEIWREWRRAATVEERERLHQCQWALSRVRTLLETHMQTGRLVALAAEQSRAAAGQNYIAA